MGLKNGFFFWELAVSSAFRSLVMDEMKRQFV